MQQNKHFTIVILLIVSVCSWSDGRSLTAQPCDANVITTDANSPLEHSVQNSECGSGATSSLLSASHPEKLISQPSNVPLCGTPRQLRAVEESEFPSVPTGERRPRSSERHFRKNFSLDPSATREKSF